MFRLIKYFPPSYMGGSVTSESLVGNFITKKKAIEASEKDHSRDNKWDDKRSNSWDSGSYFYEITKETIK